MTTVSLGLMIHAEDNHRPDAHRSHIDGHVIATVDMDADTHRVTIQTSDPDALRNLAGALLIAANKADDLNEQRRQEAADMAAAALAEAEAEPGYDLDPAEVWS